jgi:chemotaxis protein MotB
MSARKKREEEEEEHVNHERWLITYADMITLLMVLFIVLFAIGQTNLAKFDALRRSLNHSASASGGGATSPAISGGTGTLSGSPALVSSVVDPHAQLANAALAQQQQQANTVQSERRTLTTAQSSIQNALDAKGLGNAVRFELTDKGLDVIIVTDHVLYDTGSAVLQPEGRGILDAIAPALVKLPNQVDIAGHTDNQPVRGGLYLSNWELSSARATSVLHYLIDSLHVPPTSLSASAYGDERPLVPNTSDANRAANRRVEILVLYDLHATQGAPL